MKIGNVLKLLRASKGLTQNQMSKQLSISQNYLSLIEQDKKMPSIDAITSFASSLSISKHALIFVSSKVPKDLKGMDIEHLLKLQQNLLSLIRFQINAELLSSARTILFRIFIHYKQ